MKESEREGGRGGKAGAGGSERIHGPVEGWEMTSEANPPHSDDFSFESGRSCESGEKIIKRIHRYLIAPLLCGQCSFQHLNTKIRSGRQ
jgi:hypothetical protein